MAANIPQPFNIIYPAFEDCTNGELLDSMLETMRRRAETLHIQEETLWALRETPNCVAELFREWTSQFDSSAKATAESVVYFNEIGMKVFREIYHSLDVHDFLYLHDETFIGEHQAPFYKWKAHLLESLVKGVEKYRQDSPIKWDDQVEYDAIMLIVRRLKAMELDSADYPDSKLTPWRDEWVAGELWWQYICYKLRVKFSDDAWLTSEDEQEYEDMEEDEDPIIPATQPAPASPEYTPSSPPYTSFDDEDMTDFDIPLPRSPLGFSDEIPAPPTARQLFIDDEAEEADSEEDMEMEEEEAELPLQQHSVIEEGGCAYFPIEIED